MNGTPVIGSLEWAASKNGALTSAEKWSLFWVIVSEVPRRSVTYPVGRLKLKLSIHPSAKFEIDSATYSLPKSTLALEAENRAAKGLTPSIRNHSYRTFLFALALSCREKKAVYIEHLYVTSLLHDIGLEAPDPNCCFAVRGGQVMRKVAVRSGVGASVAKTLAEAITDHITPRRVGSELGPLPRMIQAGSLLDATGIRLWDISKDYERSTLKRYPRLDLKDQISARWKNEVATFPEGRAALVERFARFSCFVRFAPFKS